MALNSLNTRSAADAGIDIDLFHPASGEPLGIVITMKGSDSQEYIDAERKIATRQKDLAKRTKDFAAGLDYDLQQAALVEKMAACFVGWKEKLEDGGFKPTIELNPGQELEATKENFKRLIKDRGFFWLRQQVQQGMDSVTNFLPKSPAPSAQPPSFVLDTTGPGQTE